MAASLASRGAGRIRLRGLIDASIRPPGEGNIASEGRGSSVGTGIGSAVASMHHQSYDPTRVA